MTCLCFHIIDLRNSELLGVALDCSKLLMALATVDCWKLTQSNVHIVRCFKENLVHLFSICHVFFVRPKDWSNLFISMPWRPGTPPSLHLLHKRYLQWRSTWHRPATWRRSDTCHMQRLSRWPCEIDTNQPTKATQKVKFKRNNNSKIIEKSPFPWSQNQFFEDKDLKPKFVVSQEL